ncbi:MAG: TIR domain-containing protein [Calditrichaceae bacterium]|nr:TIR domain-containing protein [Calditrichia bacterium]NUQ39862.1 TIR domain-containing protein [Calditrichaceae bacterium]
MADQDSTYDVFLSHAGEDDAFVKRLADELERAGATVFEDGRSIKPGEHIALTVSKALKASRKLVFIMTPASVSKKWPQAEALYHPFFDPANQERRLIPLMLEDCQPPDLIRPLKYIDFRNPDDYPLRFRELAEALDLVAPAFERREREKPEFEERELRGRETYKRGKVFEQEVATLYKLLGFEVGDSQKIDGIQIDLTIHQKRGISIDAAVECKDLRVTAKERDQIIAASVAVRQKYPAWRSVVISSRGFAEDSRTALQNQGIECKTYPELLRELLPLEQYVQGIIRDYEERLNDPKNWDGRDLFIRPWMTKETTGEQVKALTLFAEWLADSRRNHLTILGDLGTGKSTLTGFLAYQLGRAFLEDPARHPAPVFIPLREARRSAFDLETIVASHFNRHGLRDVKFSNFEHLLHAGKIILFFDAFDEMADRIRWEETRDNFNELKRAVSEGSKVILTCRTHYFKNREEQIEILGKGPSYSEAVTELYKAIAGQPGHEIANLCEFTDEQIREYLRKARPQTHQADWRKIQDIYDLQELAHRPLLLEMIVKSLPQLKKGAEITAADLYTVYTDIWIQREEHKHPLLKPEIKLALMLELAGRMWRRGEWEVSEQEMLPFVEELLREGRLALKDEEARDITREMHTATFLKRGARDAFAFMHRSFMEYFLARKICQEIGVIDRGGKAQADPASSAVEVLNILETRRLDQKIVFFIAGLDKHDLLKAPLKKLLQEPYREQISENALQILYWSGRVRAGAEKKISDVGALSRVLAERIPPAVLLPQAQLNEINLELAPLERANLRGAILSSANLNSAKLSGADLQGVDLSNARCLKANFSRANLSYVMIQGANFDDADLRGAELTDVIPVGASFMNARIDPHISLWELLEAIGYRIAHVGSESFLVNIILESKTKKDGLETVVQLGHAGIVYSVAFHPTEDLIATGGGQGMVKLWRRSDQRLLRTFKGHSAPVSSVVFSPDGKSLASGSDDQSVKVWAADSGKEIRTLKGHSKSVNSVCFSPDGKTLASGSADQSVKVWAADSGKEIRTLKGHSKSVNSVGFSPDGKTLASGSADQTVKVWAADSGKEIRTLQGHSNSVNSVGFSPDGKTLASGSADQTVKVWAADSGKEIRTLKGHSDDVVSVVFSPDGNILASGGDDQTVKLWEVASGIEIRTLKGHSAYIRSVAFAPDGKVLASGSGDQNVKLWKAASGKEICILRGHSADVSSVTFSPDGNTLAFGSGDESVKLWGGASGKEIRTFKGHSNGVSSVAFSPDGKTLVSGGDDQTVKLWEVASGREISTLKGHSDYIWSVAISPDGKTLASGSEDQTVKLWEVISSKEIRTLKGHSALVFSVAFAPDGKILASGSEDQTVKLWEVVSGREIRTLKGHSAHVWQVAFAPDGKALASGGGDKTVKLWKTTSGKEIRTFKGHSAYVVSVAFSPDGKLLASGSWDQSVKLWDVASGREICTLKGHFSAVWSVGFSPDGNILASGSLDGSIRLWSVEKSQEICAGYFIAEGVWLVLLPDGRFDASPAGLRYLCYTEKNGFASYSAEDLAKEFYRPEEVQAEIARYLGDVKAQFSAQKNLPGRSA